MFKNNGKKPDLHHTCITYTYNFKGQMLAFKGVYYSSRTYLYITTFSTSGPKLLYITGTVA
jgi:hypothetical protein